MKMKIYAKAFLLAGAVTLAAGCAQPRTVYVPIYPGPVMAYPAAPGTVQAPPNAVPPVVLLDTRNVAPMPPPAPQPEAIPAVPAGDYAWMPGHWGWNGAWIWIGGRWMVKPYVTARWEPGFWEKRGHKYFWIEGTWR